MLAAFQQYGLQPGPLLFSSRPDLVWTLIASLYIGNVMLLVLNLPLVGVWARVMLVPRRLLFGGIMVLGSLGAYSLNRSVLDLVMLYIVGVVGCAMRVLRLSARAGGDRPDPRAAVGAAVPPRAGHQRRRSLGVCHASDLRRAAWPWPCWRCRLSHGSMPASGRRSAVRHASLVTTTSRCSAAATPGCARRSTAREAGASVIVLERAPRHFRGGNSRHTRNLRCMHDAPTDVLTDAYPEEEFWRTCCGSPAARPTSRWRAWSIRAVGELPGVDAALRRPLSAVAARHAAPGAHQRVLPRRRQGADEQLLRGRRAPAASTSPTTPRSSASTRATARFQSRHRADRRPASATIRARAARARRRRLRVEPRLAARDLGRRRRQLHHPRHAVQHGHAC